jgi:hypothetical protein
MAFGATITLTVNAVAKVLNRINQDNYGSEYSLESALDTWNLRIRHSVDKPDSDGMVMKRHNFYLEHITFPTTLLPMYKESVTWTTRHGKYDGNTQVGYDAKACLVYLAASSYAAVDDLNNGLN